MKRPRCAMPIAAAELAEYWLGELDELGEARVDAHLLGCDHCTETLQGLIDLRAGIGTTGQHGVLRAVMADGLVEQLAAAGLRLREYRVVRNGSVTCTVAPDDDVVIARLEAPLGDVEQLDLLLFDVEGRGYERLQDIPFNPAAAHVSVAPNVDGLRKLPQSTARIQLLTVERGHERVVGDYTFVHRPWASD